MQDTELPVPNSMNIWEYLKSKQIHISLCIDQ